MAQFIGLPDRRSIMYELFLLGSNEGWVYETPVPSIEDLTARISVFAKKLSEMPGIFHSVRNSMRRRYEAFWTNPGRKFEHLL